ncbi:ABC transporter substrate-binding protein [Pantoea sp. NPDC088449]|uniref:ABC transporter substrate-binding protein n=1 Tax=Pantoea sp. NPDC088449 TaxID=3364392 RepID=UPI00381CA119
MRFPLIRALLASLLLTAAACVAADPITVTDIAGRQVTLAHPAQRVILADARALQALQIVHPDDPFKNLIAWDNTLKTKAPDLYALYLQRFPQLSKLPMLENAYLSDFSVERTVQMRPDLIIFDFGVLEKLKQSRVLDQLEKIGVPVVFIDFRLRPLSNSVPSIRLLGKVLGDEQHAEAWSQFYQQRLSLIRDRTASLTAQQRPLVFIERHAGMTGDECCFTYGNGSFGEFIETAGGKNVGSDLFSGKNGTIGLEQLITSQPGKYLMTGADWSDNYKQSIGVPLGYTADLKLAQQRLDHLLNRNGLNVLKAVKQRDVMVIYHQFYDSPLNILAVEAMAKFLHPQLFTDLNPQADLETVHHDFLKMPYSGLFWLTATP